VQVSVCLFVVCECGNDINAEEDEADEDDDDG